MPALSDVRFDALRAMGYTGSSSDMLRQWLQAIVGNLNTITINNVLDNPAFAGVSGSVAGGDWVAPTDWGQGFWPPDEAGVVDLVPGVQSIGMEATANRGILQQTITVPAEWIGQTVNLSFYVDEVTVNPTNRTFVIQSGASVIQYIPTNIPTPGRYSGTYVITDTELLIRLGLGVTANANGDFAFSRPQLTLGVNLLPWVDGTEEITLPVPSSIPDLWRAMLVGLLNNDGGGGTPPPVQPPGPFTATLTPAVISARESGWINDGTGALDNEDTGILQGINFTSITATTTPPSMVFNLSEPIDDAEGNGLYRISMTFENYEGSFAGDTVPASYFAVTSNYRGDNNFDQLQQFLEDNAGLPINISWVYTQPAQFADYSAANYHRSDFWYALLGNLGYTGSMNDRELAFWVAGGDPTSPNPFRLVTDDDVTLTTDIDKILEAS